MTKPTKFRKKPVVIEAVQWTGDNIDAVMAFMHPQEPVHVNDLSHMRFTNADDLVGIQTLEGLIVADKGDWIIRGTRGELYPCKPGPFADTFEPVTSDADGHTCAPHGRTTEADCPACHDAEQVLARGDTHL